ncbi:MAG TPA: hypothetical protein VLK33_05540 [Terriglobales bacterium]|nr:hypothetical protein [Terriglobales bacterium]
MIHRAHVLLPDDLVKEIDALVGPRGRSAFLVETARNEVRRQKLLKVLENDEPVWKDDDSTDSAEWVRNLRHESEGRLAFPKGPSRENRKTKRKTRLNAPSARHNRTD